MYRCQSGCYILYDCYIKCKPHNKLKCVLCRNTLKNITICTTNKPYETTLFMNNRLKNLYQKIQTLITIKAKNEMIKYIHILSVTIFNTETGICIFNREFTSHHILLNKKSVKLIAQKKNFCKYMIKILYDGRHNHNIHFNYPYKEIERKLSNNTVPNGCTIYNMSGNHHVVKFDSSSKSDIFIAERIQYLRDTHFNITIKIDQQSIIYNTILLM